MRKIIFILSIVFFSLFICSCSNSSIKGPDNSGFHLSALGQLENDFDDINLTCYAHDDNLYYNEWHSLVYSNYGIFNYYNEMFDLNTNNRIKVIVPRNVYAEISLLHEHSEVVYTIIPNDNGICYLFPSWNASSYNISVKYFKFDSVEPIIEVHSVYKELRLNIVGTSAPRKSVDLMFVVDSTASMDDELKYLKNEIADVVERVSSFNDCSVKTAILLYKDKGELYETLYSDFTSNISEQIAFLENKIAYGGGDFEESVEVAIEEASQKSWSDNSTKVLIHISDAPAHDENINEWYQAIEKISSRGIRLITVASSGINKKTEYLFRTMTILNNGTYVALTNHSGVGDEHIDSSITEEVTIEYLDNCLVRLINCYHTGIDYDPIPIN